MKTTSFKILCLLVGFIFAAPAFGASAFDFEFTSIEGQPMPMSVYKGQVVLVVNTATACGSTAQLGDLQKLYADYKDKGLVVVAAPSAQFGQEPRKGHDIKEFCSVEYGAEYPMTDLLQVAGPEAHPFFKWAAEQSTEPSWNFFKYLVNRDGSFREAFGTSTQPTSAEMVSAVEQALAK